MMYNLTKLMQAGNIKVNVRLRSGLPLETEALFARSFNKAFGMAEGNPVHIDKIYALKGSVLRNEAARFGYVYASYAPYELISTGHMTSEELLRVRRIARTVECYIGDGGFRRSIPRMLTDTGIKPYELFRSLTKYIVKNDLSGKLRKQENQARILYEYAGGLYDELADSVKLDILRDVIYADLSEQISEEAIRKFDRKGWEL